MRFGAMGLGLCLTVAAAIPGWAQQPTQAQASAIRSACRADYQVHCAGVPTGGTAALSCLQQNAAGLSGPCQQALAAVDGAPAGPSAPAAPVMPRPRGGAAPPAAAPQAHPSPRTDARYLRQFCAADFRRLCTGVRPGGGAAVGCLRENAQALSPGCIKALRSAKTLD